MKMFFKQYFLIISLNKHHITNKYFSPFFLSLGETPAAVQHNSGCGIFVVDSVQNTQIKFLSSLFVFLFTTFYTSTFSARTSLTTRILVTIPEMMLVV